MPIQKTCEHCGDQFSIKPSKTEGRKFCSFGCKTAHETIHGRPAAQVAALEFTCRVCSSTFTMKPSYLKAYHKKFNRDPLYCSMPCMGMAKRLADEAWQVDCVQCGKPMPIQRRPGGTINRQKRLCSTECRSLFRRLSYQTNNPDQQPTKRVARHGYVRLIIPGTNGQPSRDTFEHRHVMEQSLGRRLYPEETVHHVNGNRQDNRLENLELFNSRHGPGQRAKDKIAFAIEMLRTYPELGLEAGFELRAIPHVPLPIADSARESQSKLPESSCEEPPRSPPETQSTS